VLQEICIAFQKDLYEDSVEVYYKYLKHYPLKIFKLATEKLIQRAKYFPKISEYIGTCEEVKLELINEKIKQDRLEEQNKQSQEIVDIRDFFKKPN
jgi:hypothetical protein